MELLEWRLSEDLRDAYTCRGAEQPQYAQGAEPVVRVQVTSLLYVSHDTLENGYIVATAWNHEASLWNDVEGDQC